MIPNNFTFPNMLFTIALVIERKQLSPEARKQTRASESVKIRSKINLTFPNILFTIALVIERKKLSPEARKQTRVSESFKITSKNKFYVSRHLSIPNNYFFICCPLFICLSAFSHYQVNA